MDPLIAFIISLIGIMMLQSIAIVWLIFRMFNSFVLISRRDMKNLVRIEMVDDNVRLIDRDK